jgi:tetratricopeptide (TPR) repeat protein
MVWNRATWRFAAPLGLAFHFGIVLSGLEIGLFAWLMIGLYALVVPDRIWIWIAHNVGAPLARAVPPTVRRWIGGRGRWPLSLAGFLIALALGIRCRFDHAIALAILLAIVVAVRTVSALVLGRPALGWLIGAHLLAFATWAAVDRTTTVATDYYLFWGGSARRLGDPDAAMAAYQRLVDIAPDNVTAHYQLGRLLMSHDRAEDGLAELHAAQQLAPDQARAFVAEAQWLAAHGRRDEARDKAREAAHAEPTDPDSRRLVEALGAR